MLGEERFWLQKVTRVEGGVQMLSETPTYLKAFCEQEKIKLQVRQKQAWGHTLSLTSNVLLPPTPMERHSVQSSLPH